MHSAQTPVHLYARRELVRTIIELANSHLGGTVSLVSVDESIAITQIEFERTYPLREVTRNGHVFETARFQVSVTEIVENGGSNDGTPVQG